MRRLRLPLGAVAALAAVVAVGAFVAEPVRVSSTSMQPTLIAGDEVLIAKWGDPGGTALRGQIVVLSSPLGGETLIKRVAAVGGDTVGIEDGRLVVNGAVQDEPYVDAALMDGTYFGPVDVADGTLFVLGDNRPDSVDSRSFGAVSDSAVQGRVLTRLWPRGG